MSIYEKPEEYAQLTRLPIDLANLRCEKFIAFKKRAYEASLCPNCGSYSLEIEGGSYEEGIPDYIYCSNEEIATIDEDGDTIYSNCDYTSKDVKEFSNIKSDYEYDVVLMYAIEFGEEKERWDSAEKLLGSSWIKFAKTNTDDLSR